MSLFTIQDREDLRTRVLGWASTDDRIVAGAVVGSLALADGDRWSDLDLTFAVADGVAVTEVLEAWTTRLDEACNATLLFDLPVGSTNYRVFLLPGCLQFDLSFSPEAEFGARGPKFKLLFGEAVELPLGRPPSAQQLFGYAAHHALRARFCIERGRFWHAEYWTSGMRDYALSLACLRRGLPARHGRGFDDLPADVLGPFQGALVRSLDRDELLRALGHAITALLRESEGVHALADRVAPELLQLRLPLDQPSGAG